MLKESEAIAEIEQLFVYLRNMGFEADFDVSLARGLSYYTGTVIEAFLKNSSIKSAVCAGGRYDKMIVSLIGKNEYAAAGISFGVDRIYDAIIKTSKTTEKTTAKVYIIPIKTLDESVQIAQKLRSSGINTDIDLADKGPSKNLEYANSLGIPYVIFVGKKELQDNKLKLRDMKTGKEEMLSFEEIIGRLKI